MKNRVILSLCFFGCCLALLTSCGGGSASSHPSSSASPTGSVRGVKVTITDSTITSSQTTFIANTPYDFTVTNRGHSPHSFIIRERPGQGVVKPQLQKGILYIIPSNQLPPGATKSFRFAFPDATQQPASPQGNTTTVQFTTQLTSGSGVEIPVKVNRA
ncbi:MAG TPA: hypothetical protein VE843_05735 [Ktedonobacteraceae bacterium]|nr:hypothetical protein [Ktedonobacteraceae bacterium]